MNVISELADKWIALQTTDESSPEYKALFPASTKLWELSRKDPSTCLAVIEDIAGKTRDEHLLANLGAGPLEDLLVAHGEAVIDDIERLVHVSESFRMAASCVWRRTSMSDSLWGRLMKLRG